MKKLLKTLIITALLALSFNPLYAGAGHEHGHAHEKEEVTQVHAEKKATKRIKKLIQKNKIDASWADAPILNVQKKKFKNNMEWVVSYENKNIENTKKQILYVFVNLYGKITGSNYTGK